jgi:carboxylesterase type B
LDPVLRFREDWQNQFTPEHTCNPISSTNMGNTISYEETPVEVVLGSKGRLRGTQFDNKACRYAGVPYALPPVGENRWRSPQPLPPSHTFTDDAGGPYNAERFRSICPQKAFFVAEADGGGDGYSEDCLFLNIWTPASSDLASTEGWPVMLWLHGGWFQMGDPSQTPDMDPTELISTGGLNAIVVAIGYRLNVFGFLAGDDLMQESDGVSGGNYGLLDQRMAIEWVHEHIAFFGGNPNNVTLAGRSAGAYAVEAHMLYELRHRTEYAPLFQRVFMDSNAIPAQPKSLRDGQSQLEELCGYFGLPLGLSAKEKLAELRKQSWRDLLQATSNLQNHTFRPVTDNILIHDEMVEYVNSANFASDFKNAGFRLLSCEVLNEETLYSTYNAPTEPNEDSLRTQVTNYYSPTVTERVLAFYGLPVSEDLEEWQKLFGKHYETSPIDNR